MTRIAVHNDASVSKYGIEDKDLTKDDLFSTYFTKEYREKLASLLGKEISALAMECETTEEEVANHIFVDCSTSRSCKMEEDLPYGADRRHSISAEITLLVGEYELSISTQLYVYLDDYAELDNAILHVDEPSTSMYLRLEGGANISVSDSWFKPTLGMSKELEYIRRFVPAARFTLKPYTNKQRLCIEIDDETLDD